MLCSIMWLQNHHSSITMLDSWQEVLYIPVLLAIRPNNPYTFNPFLSVLSWTLALNMIIEACKVCDEALGFLSFCLWALHSLTLGEICKDVLSWKHCKVVLTQTWSKMRKRERCFCKHSKQHCVFDLADFLHRIPFLTQITRAFVSPCGTEPGCSLGKCVTHYTMGFLGWAND